MAPVRSLPFLCGALLLAFAPVSQALQLGENEAQIVARHGAPAVEDHGRKLAVYFWEGWSAQAEFKDGLVNKLTYRRTGYLTDAEIQALLQANGGVTRWKETTNRGGKARQWTRDDGANAQCAAVRPSTILFQGGRALTASEAILHESFLEFAAPANPVAATPVPSSGRGSGEPVVLSNVAPAAAAAPEVQVKDTPAPSSAADIPAEEKGPPAESTAVVSEQTAVPSAPVAVAPSKPVLSSVPAVMPAEKKSGPSALVIIGCALLGILGSVSTMLRKRKSARAQSRAHPAPPRPAVSTSVRRANAPVAAAAPAPDASESATPELQTMRWDQFELLVGEIFRRHGYNVELSAALGADGGVDLMLRRDGECIPVQCKHWKTSRVAAREMREFYGTMTDAAAPRGIFVTTGTFTRDAREFAEGKAIELLDGPALQQRIDAIRRPEENIFDVTSWIGDFTAAARIFDPECPFCKGAMVIRHHRSTGAAVWGCATYPRCAGKRDPRADLMAAA
jgi:hypothetical protein